LRGDTLEIGAFGLSSKAIGTLSVSGEWPLAPSAAPGKLVLETQDLWLGDWRTPPVEEVPRLTSKLDFSGHTEDWKATLSGTWRIGERSGPIALEVAGTPERLIFAPSRIELAQSAIDFSGELSLGEVRDYALDLNLTQVDPGLFAPEWPGLLDGKLRLNGRFGEVPTWQLDIDTLAGELRKAPVSLSGNVSGNGAALDVGDLDLKWGTGGAKLSVPSPGEIALDMTAFDLRQLGPYEGIANGRVSWRPDEDPIVSSRAQLVIERLLVAGTRIAHVDVDKQPDFNARISAQGLETFQPRSESGKFKLAELTLTAAGSAGAHVIELIADNERARLELAANGSWAESVWTGSVARLQLSQKDGGTAWTLAEPANLRIAPEQIALSPLCLQAADARLCVGYAREVEVSTIDVRTEAFPLAELNAWMPESGIELSGKLDGGGRVVLNPEAKTGGTLDFRISDASVRGARTYEQAVAFDGTLRFDSASGELAASLSLPGHGSVEVNATGLELADAAPCAPVAAIAVAGDSAPAAGAPCGRSGRVHAVVDITDLSFVDGVTAEIQSVRGALKGELDGPLADPLAASGKLESSGLQFELPALGLKATSGKVVATLAGDRLLKLDGKFAIAPGELTLEGTVGLGSSDLTELHIRSDNAGLIDLPAVRLAGDTDFVVSRKDGGFAIDGGILLRGGRIDLDRFAPDVPPSEDVVIEDAPVAAPGPPITADVSIAFIQAVDLRGYGLEATLGGGVRITQRPNARTLGAGELTATGIYNAYGQKLTIERGRLVFGGGRADNPRLDILAVKRINRQRVGVRVRGTAKRPLATLYSDPSLEQSETLSYLVLGRPLSTANGADGQRLGEYADALETAGGNLVAGSIGKRLGLSAGVESLGSAIGSALVVGKYLSPRFFVGYGTALLDATQLVILRYQITENIDLEFISGREQKASVSWRTER
jgi:translocation and assembly module TamB